MAPLLVLFAAPQNFEAQIPIYEMLLGEIPGDLLAQGIKSCLRDCRFFPKPAEIIDPISDRLYRRRHTVRRLETALMFAKRPQIR